ncbi:MAG: hypothetical protein FWH36_03340 [Lentimicrobiaceae bacterium]|nr:hypothetical protein [Lentimicrobiaceae bacterium]
MKKQFILFLLATIYFSVYTQNEGVAYDNSIFKSIKIFYLDTLTNEGEKEYREFLKVQEEPYFCKPHIFDVYIELKDVYLRGVIEIFIENYYVPDTSNILKIRNCNEFSLRPYWGLEQVICHKHFYKEYEKCEKIELNGIVHQTAYYTDSRLYGRHGFRIVAVYMPFDSDNIEIYKREYILNE